MKTLRIFLILTIIFNFATAQEQENTFQLANTLYSEGKYDQAITNYEKLLNKDKHSATIYYNLANAYFKKGALAPAILNYERAYRLEPYDKDIQSNLAFANSQVSDKIIAPKRYFIAKWFNEFMEQWHSNQWAYIGIFFWIMLFLFITFFLKTFSEKKRKIFFSIASISLIIALFCLYASYNQYNSVQKNDYAIIFAQSITVNSTPSNNGTTLFILHEGTKVKILDKVGNWYKIQLADLREGWLPAKDITKI